MELYANFSQPVTLYTHTLAWIDSPLAGVQRRLLDRIGAEVARATSIVAYAPESQFSPHGHGGGEEFLVLSGIFSDEWGHYPAGTYVRNPCGSSHQPFSQGGCQIFVKLWQMHPEDQTRVVVDTTQAPWQSTAIPGLEVMPLHQFGSETVTLVKLAPATRVYPRLQTGGEEILILSGELTTGDKHYPSGTWLRHPNRNFPQAWSESGCLLYVKTGHLPAVLEESSGSGWAA